MIEARLKIIDKLLQKGWQSFYDFARTIYGGQGETYSYYQEFYKLHRASIAQDFRSIQDIWAWAHRGEVLQSGHDKTEKNPVREEIKNEVFAIKKQKQFVSDQAPELYQKDGPGKNPRVTFYRYKDPKYSIFKSGDYEKYVAFKTKNKAKSAVERSINTAVTQKEVDNVLYDTDVVLEPEVSAQIKRSIRLQEELTEFAEESKEIVDSLLQSISAETDQKKRNWVRKTVNNYRNILELVKNPLSRYNPREIADSIHSFAFFLASENQYHLLGSRFDEALTIYQKLQREQRHLMEDAEQGLLEEEMTLQDIKRTKEQMLRDDEAVASILLSMARVRLDSGELEAAGKFLKKAESLAGDETFLAAQICHAGSIIATLQGDQEKALASIEHAAALVSALGKESTPEGLSILASQAEWLHRCGDVDGAKALYATLVQSEDAEVKASAGLQLSLISLSEGQIDAADVQVSLALELFRQLFDKDPDKHLPNLLTAQYLKGLVLMHQGKTDSAITQLETAATLVPENRPDLLSLCGTELLEVYITLHDLYKDSNKTQEIKEKARGLLNSPALYISNEERAQLEKQLS